MLKVRRNSMASRRLTPTEQAEAWSVFGEAVEYARVRVYEDAGWTNALPRLHARLARRPAPSADNAVTLGHRVSFPRRLDTAVEATAAGRFADFGWLMHELTHAWQAERIGVRYLLQALQAQVRLGEQVYDYGGEEGLRRATGAGFGLRGFNVEQQAEIARDLYMRRKHGLDVSAWMPFAAELARALPPP